MKLLHVIASMDPKAGGPCQGIRNLSPYFSEHDHEVEVVCLDEPNASYLASETLPTHALGQGRGSWCYHSSLRPWLVENMRRFDAVVLNGLWQYPGFVLSKLAKDPDSSPYYVFPHGMLDPWFQRAPERRVKAIRNWLYWKLIEHQVVHQAEALLFTCAEEMRLARDTFRPYQPKRQVNVGFGISEPPARTQAMQAAFEQSCPGVGGRPYLIFLGRIHPKKGVELLIQAYATVYGAKLESNPGLPRLVMAGPGGETAFGLKMRELAGRTCPAASVHWPGMLTGDAKWGALYGAEAFALVSHQENFGIAVVEALSCGTPVLISNQINIWQEIKEDHAGFICDDTLAGAEQVLRRWEGCSPEENLKMKRAAQFCYENRFGVATAAQSLMTFLEESAKQRMRQLLTHAPPLDGN